MKLVDTLRNLVTGLGTSKDKTVSNVFVSRFVDESELNSMYRSDWLARKIVDIIPNDMTREWRDWQAEEKQIEAIEAVEKSPLINLQVKVNQALRKARLLGGAAIFIGMKDNTPDKPLDPAKVKKGDLLYLHVLHRYEITTGEIIRDVLSEDYGKPAYYQVTAANSMTARVHPSRVVAFVGAEMLDERQNDMSGWGDSILQVVYDAIQAATSVHQHVAALIPEAKTDVISIPKLSEYLENATTTAALTSRFTYANTIKSMFNMVLLEGNGEEGEQWQQKSVSFEKLPELMHSFMQIAAGASDIPVTRLLGESPAGLNATGEGDIRNYYDNIAARQRTELAPHLNRLDEIIIRSALGDRPAEIYYDWAPLWTSSEKEKAEIFKTKADAARALVGSSAGEIIPIEAVSDALVNVLTEDGSLPGLQAAIDEYGRLSEQEDDEADLLAAAQAGSPDNVIPMPGAKRPAVVDAAPRSLYVRRDVVNKGDLRRWAKSQGLDMVADPHVTIIHSKTAIDWMKVNPSWSPKIEIEGGPRLMDLFSPTGDTLVLLIPVVGELRWRHEEFKELGATSDYDPYAPHITIVKGFTGKLEDITPYQGKIVLGPEIFEEVKP